MTRRDWTIAAIAVALFLWALLPNLPGAIEGVRDLFGV